MTSTQTRHPLDDVPALFATPDAVVGQPGIAQFQLRSRDEWVHASHTRSTVQGCSGAGQEDSSRTGAFTCDADHPADLVGGNNGAIPVEVPLHAIASKRT